MADLISILTSAAGGGLVGVIGQVANRVMGVWEAKEKRADQVIANAQEEKRWAHETDLLKIQMQQAQEANEQALNLAASQGSWDGLRASLDAEGKIGPTYRWVEAVRALTRPFLTIESQVALAVVFFAIRRTADHADLVNQVVDTVTFCASASLLWWFGERAQARKAVKG